MKQENPADGRRAQRCAKALWSAVLLYHIAVVLIFGSRIPVFAFDLPVLAALVVFAKRRLIGYDLPLLYAGALTYLLIEPSGIFHPLCWFALVPFFFVIDRGGRLRDLAAKGLWTGVVIATGIYGWLFEAMYEFFEFGIATAVAVFLAVSTIIAAQIAVFFAASRWAADVTRLPLWLTGPLVYIVAEFWAPLPFPIAIALGLSGLPFFLQPADIGGMHLVSLLVVIVSTGLFVGIRSVMQGNRKRASYAFCVAVIVFVIHCGYSFYAWDRYATVEGPHVDIALIQPVAPLKVDSQDEATRKAIADTLERLTREALSATQVDLVLWPEGAGAFAVRSPAWNSEYVEAIRRLQSEYSVPFIVQDVEFTRLPESGAIGYYSAATLVDPVAEPVENYRKNIRMPFTEYLPFEERFPFLRRLLPEARSLLAGDTPVTLEGAPGGAALPVICYEILFPSYVRRGVSEDTAYLVNLTNDRWYGERQQPVQHQSFAVFRAIENRRPVARATNSGISAIIDARGAIDPEHRTKVMEQTALTGRLTAGSGQTIYQLIGNTLFSWILTPALAGLLLWGRRRGRRGAEATD